jgi:protein ImuA
MPHESHPSIAGLRRRLARITGEAEPRAETAGRLASGHADFDAALGGGLATGRVHEFFTADALDATSAAAFAALLALRLPGPAPLVWLRTADAARRGGHI